VRYHFFFLQTNKEFVMTMPLLWMWALLALVLLILIVAATRPDSFRVERVLQMPADAERVLAQINDFRLWAAWSPWEKIDPSMQRSYSGAPQGVGAVYAWTGNGKAGAGRMEIIETSAQHITIKIDFFKPFTAHNTVEFRCVPQATGTELHWAMFGPSPFVSKLMGLFFNMDRMIGRDFETGLRNLREVVMAAPSADALR
jgi:Polyketide cyclase / dehydrase and lipid transport